MEYIILALFVIIGGQFGILFALTRRVNALSRIVFEEARHNSAKIGGILSVLGTMNGIDVDAILAEGQEKWMSSALPASV